jgi:hypothetical protein
MVFMDLCHRMCLDAKVTHHDVFIYFLDRLLLLYRTDSMLATLTRYLHTESISVHYSTAHKGNINWPCSSREDFVLWETYVKLCCIQPL